MKELNFTNHALTRCQQRGIPLKVVEFIVKNGKSTRTHESKKFYINKSKLKLITRENKDFIAKNDQHILKTAVVVNGDEVLTAMKITKHVKWN